MTISAIPVLPERVALATLLLISTAASASSTLWVKNNGADSNGCGAATTPCRSIGQAIENAADGDTIEVGAGFYGDVSGAGTFTGPGDEHAQRLRNSSGCIVCITKAVRIFSLHGAAQTVIQGQSSDTGQFLTTVLIAHDGVTFGTQDHGFTLRGGNIYGVQIDTNVDFNTLPFSVVAGIRVGGNVDIGDRTAFEYDGPMWSDNPCRNCIYRGQISWLDNEAIGNGASGFAIRLGQYDREPVLLQGNLAQGGGGTGFLVAPGPSSQDGLDKDTAGSVALVNNTATANGLGFDANSTGDIRGNVAVGNSQAGFILVPNGGSFSGNNAVGNGGPGVIVNFSKDTDSPIIDPTIPIPTFHTFSHNNFFGNDRNRPVITLSFGGPVFNPGPGAHCGVLNVGALSGPAGLFDNPHPGPPVHLVAANNFWGSAHGPSPTGPGDAVGGACDENNATTTGIPFSAVGF